ncbi:DEAD/DEAH box helicase [Sphingomonas sp. BN140010]|uniref:DEAD/DEAH box helicase n=1 Tax=Sphingomonas arvum TaxID=2992113 RepID=A0ABT3JE85_9SPHN|nr:DEAD/DEAH box helicase [Sphingomonas sp. BN140010]MCW3797400.1 DEAD/DEAH box helicase [Sphingomonas sp. BN140010]
MENRETPILVRSVLAGAHHLAGLLEQVAGLFAQASIVHTTTPDGAAGEGWTDWLRAEAERWPYLWENHRRAVQTGYLNAGASSVMSSPTGSGKTTLAVMKIAATLTAGRTVVYLAPTHALVGQIERDLTERVGRLAQASSVEDALPEELGQQLPDLAVLTPEKCFALLTFAPELFRNVGLLVFDECHLLGVTGADGAGKFDRRSIDAMLCLLNFMSVCPAADYLLLSAMMSNGEDIAEWLSGLLGRPVVAFQDQWKPTRQLKSCLIYDRTELIRVQNQLTDYWNSLVRKPSRPTRAAKDLAVANPFAVFALKEGWNPRAAEALAIRRVSDGPWSLGVGQNVRGWYPTANRFEIAGDLAARFAEAGLKVVVFCESIVGTGAVAKEVNRRSAPANARLTERQSGWRSAALEELGTAESLYDVGRSRAAVHHGELLSQERLLVESVFKDRKSGLQVLAATSTIAQGLNLPCDVVILAGTDRLDDTDSEDIRTPLEPHEILNALGRAGRAGLSATGLAFVVPADLLPFDARTARIDPHDLFSTVFGGSDQCVPLSDPISGLYDRIAAEGGGRGDSAYLLRRLALSFEDAPAGIESFDALSRRSFGYYQRAKADRQAAERWLEERKATLTGLIKQAREKVVVVDWEAQLAAKTGASLDFVSKLVAAYPQAPLEVDDAEAWVGWLLDQLPADGDDFEAFLRMRSLEKVFGRALNEDDPVRSRELSREGLKLALRSWFAGERLNEMEARIVAFINQHEGAVSRPTAIDARAQRARRFVIRVAPDLGYLCGLLGQISKKLRADADQPPLLLLEALPQLVRSGLHNMTQFFVHRDTSSRVQSCQMLSNIAQHVNTSIDDSWEVLADKIDRANLHLTFGEGNFEELVQRLGMSKEVTTDPLVSSIGFGGPAALTAPGDLGKQRQGSSEQPKLLPPPSDRASDDDTNHQTDEG